LKIVATLRSSVFLCASSVFDVQASRANLFLAENTEAAEKRFNKNTFCVFCAFREKMVLIFLAENTEAAERRFNKKTFCVFCAFRER